MTTAVPSAALATIQPAFTDAERVPLAGFLTADGRWLDRHAAGRISRRTARRAGLAKLITPHALRHAFITAAPDAGGPAARCAEAASHADPRTRGP